MESEQSTHVQVSLPQSTPTGYENPLRKAQRKRDISLIIVGGNFYGFLLRSTSTLVYSILLVSSLPLHIQWVNYTVNTAFFLCEVILAVVTFNYINNRYLAVVLSLYSILLLVGYCLGVSANGAITGVG